MRPARELRSAIDCMPVTTRRAMLDGIDGVPIIVGGYTDGQGGICPMLAAHRNGGRTAFATFAHAWDRYTKADGERRRATEREVRTLAAMLQASIEVEDTVGEGMLGEAVRDHRETQVRRAHREEFEVTPLGPADQTLDALTPLYEANTSSARPQPVGS